MQIYWLDRPQWRCYQHRFHCISPTFKNDWNYLQLLYSRTQMSVSERLWASVVIHESHFLFFIALCTFRKQVSLCNEIHVFRCLSPFQKRLWACGLVICAFRFPVYFRRYRWETAPSGGPTQVQQHRAVSMKNATFGNIFIACSEEKISKNVSL